MAGEQRAMRRPSNTRSLVGPALALIGSAAVVISGWLPWLGTGSVTADAFDEPAYFLLDSTARLTGLRLGPLVIVVGAVGVIGALIPGLRFLAILSGLAAVALGALFFMQTNFLLDAVQGRLGALGLGGALGSLDLGAMDLNLVDLVDYGVYVAIVGGAVATVGGILSLASR